jgi:hypothetical protein
VGEPVRVAEAQLKPAQRKAIDALSSGGTHELTRARYQELAGVSRSQAAYDLADLVEAGILLREGAGRATRYRLARAPQSGRRRWTSDRIRAELTEFCSDRAAWPSAAEFKGAGRSDLYVAASRYGGIGFWVAELGFARSGRGAHDNRVLRPSWLRRAALPLAAAVVAAVGVVGVLVLGSTDSPPVARTSAGGTEPSARSDTPRNSGPARVARSTRPSKPAASAAPVELVLRAARGSSRIVVRSSAGKLLFEGVLTRGRRLSFHANALWVRAGAAANLDAAVNGPQMRRLPSNAALMVVTARGVRIVERTSPRPTAATLVAQPVAPATVRTRPRAVTQAATPRSAPETRGPAPLRAPAPARQPEPLPAP